MAKDFTITGTCIPAENYMVDITDKLGQIKKMIDRREYFVINRGRQYGKTTTLKALKKYLTPAYTVISISFESLDVEEFENAHTFIQAFLRKIHTALKFSHVDPSYRASWLDENINSFNTLSDHITALCEGKKIVLMIDEVDKSSNNRVFLGFLSKLREKFLARKAGEDFTFHSVILAGISDVRNIKLKLIQEGLHTQAPGEIATYNSPWNIASLFTIDMSFSPQEIAGMLTSYEADHHSGMDIPLVAREIYHYTSGYPVLVSHICKNIAEGLDKDWTPSGVRRSVKLLLKEKSPLFDSLTKNLIHHTELYNLLVSLVIQKRKWSYNPDDEMIDFGVRYGYLTENDGTLAIANKIFEIRLMNYFTTKKAREELNTIGNTHTDDGGIVTDGQLNMDVCLEKFSQYFQRYYSQQDAGFLEREGRILFLMFIAPVLNGQGFAYIEAQSPDGKRTDVIVNYLNKQYVIELKIWDGQKKHAEAIQQLLGYMERFQTHQGYLLTFDFRSKKVRRHEWIDVGENRKILDTMV